MRQGSRIRFRICVSPFRIKGGSFKMDLFAEAFVQRALIGGLLIGLTAPLIGVFVVLRRLSMIGDTLSHISIAGVALGFLLNLYPLAVGLVFAVFASLLIERLRRAYRTYAELSIAVMMSGGVALASLLFSLGKGFSVNISSYFFGSIYTLENRDLIVVAAVTLVVAITVRLNYKELFLLTFDEDAAAVNGLPIRTYNVLLTTLTAIVVSIAIKIIGALLVSALITIPVASSLMAARSFRQTVLYAIIYAELAILGGLVASALWDLPPGGTVVLLLITLLIGTLTVRTIRT